MGARGTLGEFEQLVLLAVLRLEGEASGSPVRDEIERRVGRPVARGAVYTTLDRLEDKGLLSSRLDERLRRRSYEVLEPGICALRESAAAVRSLWEGLESVLGER